MNLSNIAIFNVKDADYHCIITRICKSEAVNLLQEPDLKKAGPYKS